MKISVVIPVYNGEKYVAQCIENLLCQTHKDLEIIVVDDGSTDRTAEIAAQFPVKVTGQPNKGAAAARNRGIEEATGNYIHFMDVDDFIGLDFYERMADAITLTDADIASCDFIHEALPHRSLSYPCRMLLTETEDKLTVTDAKRQGACWRWLFRRSLLTDNELRFPEGWLIEDLPFVLQATFLASKIVTVPGAVYYYKNRSGSIMRAADRNAVLHRRAETKKTNAFCNEFMRSRGIGPAKNTVHIFDYKILGIPVLKKHILWDGAIKWYMLGIRVVRKKPLR